MSEQTIKPERITKPIQLLGAWLAGLFTIDSCFLFAAAKMQTESWQSGALTIAAIVNVPLFLTAVFLLQTRFRPELQEDSYYSTYLSKKTNEPVNVSKEDSQLAQLRQRLAELEDKIAATANKEAKTATSAALSGLHIGVNRHLTDKQHIGAKLSELGILGFTTFGGSSPPEKRVVAISEHLSKERIKQLIGVAKELGFAGYTFFDNMMEDATEDVLFGSYGDATYEIGGGNNLLGQIKQA